MAILLGMSLKCRQTQSVTRHEKMALSLGPTSMPTTARQRADVGLGFGSLSARSSAGQWLCSRSTRSILHAADGGPLSARRRHLGTEEQTDWPTAGRCRYDVKRLFPRYIADATPSSHRHGPNVCGRQPDTTWFCRIPVDYRTQPMYSRLLVILTLVCCYYLLPWTIIFNFSFDLGRIRS